MAALKHSLKIALHVYDALPNQGAQEYWFGLLQVWTLRSLFRSLDNCLEQDDTLAEQRCLALTEDGVHAAAMLLSAYRAGAECRLSRADAAWVRNVIADSENFLPDLLREVP